MPRRVGPPQRVILDVAVAVERLRVLGPPRTICLLLLLVTQLEPEAKLVFLIELAEELGLMEIDRKRLDGHPVHAARGVAGDNGVSRDEAPNGRVIIPGSIRRPFSRSRFPMLQILAAPACL